MEEFWVHFTVVIFVLMLVLQWCFCNKLDFGDFGDFQNLKTKKLVSGFLILRET
jgi:hypothetical protein